MKESVYIYYDINIDKMIIIMTIGSYWSKNTLWNLPTLDQSIKSINLN